MDHTGALVNNTAGGHKSAGALTVGQGLQVSKSVLQFDQTYPGDESFLTLRITPPRMNAVVVISVQDVALFQVAVGVAHLAFKQTLTFKPEATGSYIHLRYTPTQTGRHQSVVTVEAPATGETLEIPLLGHTGGLSALTLPAVGALPGAKTIVRRPAGNWVRNLVLGGLLIGAGLAGYTYRCQIWPASCGPTFGQPAPTVNEPAISQPATEPLPTVTSAERSATPKKERTTNNVTTTKTERSTERTAKKTRRPETPAPEATLKSVAKAPSRDETREVSAPPATATPPGEDRTVTRTTRSTAKNSALQAVPKAKPVPVSARKQPVEPVQKPAPVARPKPNEESELEKLLNNNPA